MSDRAHGASARAAGLARGPRPGSPRAALRSSPTAATASSDVIRLATLRAPGASAPQVAALRGDRAWLLGARYPGGLPQVIESWQGSAALAAELQGAGVPLADCTLLAPLPAPSSIVCVGKNYRDHVKEMDSAAFGTLTQPDVPAAAIIFSKAPTSVCGPGDAIVIPTGASSQVDYEGELCAVVGRSTRRVLRGEALQCIFGYTVSNDVSARDLQKKHQQWYLAKSCDTFCPLGPWVVPADALDASALRVRTWVNGELRQDGNTRDMIFPLAQLVEVISAGTTLRPGDVILTGTPAGVGAGFSPPRFLAPGDVVRVEIEGIGVLENRVAAGLTSAL
jgi:2-keto-4-pentenoate hydratase/2-oxohepta-3-ene-1,7-dioic acid hydratase in catechol pathway